jgi:hypothetical protein
VSGKGDVCTDEKPKDEKKCEVTSLLKKVEVLDKPSSGMRIAAVRCH